MHHEIFISVGKTNLVMKLSAVLFALPLITAPALLQSGVGTSQLETAKPQKIGVTTTAVSPSQAAVCSKMGSSAKRLACFDLYYKSNPPASKETDTGEWRINASFWNRDNTPRVLIRVANNLPIQSGKPQQRNVFLYAACRSGKTTIWLNYHHQLRHRNQGGFNRSSQRSYTGDYDDDTKERFG